MLNMGIGKEDPRTHCLQKYSLIAVVLLCSQGRLVGLSCCLVICAALIFAIIFSLFLCNRGWYCYELPLLNFFNIGWNSRGIRNTGLGKISWLLGPVSCSSTHSYVNLFINSFGTEGRKWMHDLNLKWCDGILSCIPMLYIWALTEGQTPCWGLIVLPRKQEAESGPWKFRAKFAHASPFKEVHGRALADGRLCPCFPVLFCPIANPKSWSSGYGSTSRCSWRLSRVWENEGRDLGWDREVSVGGQ